MKIDKSLVIASSAGVILTGIILYEQFKPRPPATWKITDLPPLYAGDCFALQPGNGLEQSGADLMRSQTFHWGIIAGPTSDNTDYVVYDAHSLAGTISENISSMQNQGMRIYRRNIDLTPSVTNELLSRMSYYWGISYDWTAGLVNYVSNWSILQRNLVSSSLNCVELVNQIWTDVGYPIITGTELVTPKSLETSPNLTLIWGSF